MNLSISVAALAVKGAEVRVASSLPVEPKLLLGVDVVALRRACPPRARGCPKDVIFVATQLPRCSCNGFSWGSADLGKDSLRGATCTRLASDSSWVSCHADYHAKPLAPLHNASCTHTLTETHLPMHLRAVRQANQWTDQQADPPTCRARTDQNIHWMARSMMQLHLLYLTAASKPVASAASAHVQHVASLQIHLGAQEMKAPTLT